MSWHLYLQGTLPKHATILYCVFFIMQLHVRSLFDIMESIFTCHKKGKKKYLVTNFMIKHNSNIPICQAFSQAQSCSKEKKHHVFFLKCALFAKECGAGSTYIWTWAQHNTTRTSLCSHLYSMILLALHTGISFLWTLQIWCPKKLSARNRYRISQIISHVPGWKFIFFYPLYIYVTEVSCTRCSQSL